MSRIAATNASAFFVFLMILTTALAVTACVNSSAATQPLEPNDIPSSPTLPINKETVEVSSTPTYVPEPPTFTPAPTETPTPSPTSTATSTSTPVPSPTPTPTPALRQLTEGGCCVQPFFSPDSRQILFLDKPDIQAPTGIYGVDVVNPQPEPVLVHEIVGFRSPDQTIVATIEGDLVRFVDEVNDKSWTVDTSGTWPRYSPDGSQILWTVTDREGPYDRRRSDIWLADLAGSNPRMIGSVVGGGFAGWLPDSQHILLINRDNLDEEERTLILHNLANDQQISLARERRLRGIEISPGGRWIAYFLTFSDEPEKDGLWVVSSDGQSQNKLDVPGFGAYRWRNDNTLLYIPMRISAEESMQLWAVDVSSNQRRPLSDPTSLIFSISNGDWEVSPDGQHIAFVNSVDQNIWLITLP